MKEKCKEGDTLTPTASGSGQDMDYSGVVYLSKKRVFHKCEVY